MNDLFGNALEFVGLSPHEGARLLYEAGDRAAAGSAERLNLYRKAAALQQRASRIEAERKPAKPRAPVKA